MKMKIVFMGTPDFAVKALEALAAKHEVVCVYTREPQEAGRGKKLTKSPVHEFAEAHGILVRTPKTLRSAEAQAELTMPVGLWIKRTAEDVLLMCWPPAPEER